jgi:hypothetical protein
MMKPASDNFEQHIRELTHEINGQYPRPWMTDSVEPQRAQVFIVGYNPATAYWANTLDYERHINALFNRNGESCRGLYAEVRQQSPSRGNIEILAEKLQAAGVTNILETNVVCYGTRKSSDLRSPDHTGGKERGLEIFRTLVKEIKPAALIVHGKGVCDEVSSALRLHPKLPGPPKRAEQFIDYQVPGGPRIFVIPSLALPGFQSWPSSPLPPFCRWADAYLDAIAKRVAVFCRDKMVERT